MSSDKPADAAPPTEAPKQRFAPKLLIVAGASATLLLAVAGGAAVWLWPKQDHAVETKSARLAARRAAAAASAAAAAQPAMAAPVAAVVSAASAAGAAGSEPPVAAALAAPADAAPPEQPPTPAVVAEAPLDRLQRRLGEVLGPRGAVDPARAGELRVLARSSSVAPVRHTDTLSPISRPPEAGSLAAPAAAPVRRGPWSYSGFTGPQAWGKLKPEYSLCAKGQRQSPIDIREGIGLDLESVRFEYQPSSFAVIDTGHTVQVNVAPGNAIEVNGRRWTLQQFHFHRPSEERIDGRQFEMDVHLVHRDAEGRMAVVAVLLERGAAQPLLQTVWNHLPLEKNEENAARVQIDPIQLLPTDRRYYTYMGSLTTPPCSEGVLWLVMQQPVPVSAQQIDIFSRLYPMNARPIQQAAGRMIKQSN